MKYDFDRVIPRYGTDCMKWDGAESIFGDKDVIPMWVADMDLPIAQPITEALQKRAQHPIYGYPLPAIPATIEAVVKRMKRKFDWTIQPEWVVITPGVVSALYAAIKAFTIPGDRVIHQDPIYYPFWSIIENNGCQVANNPLRLVGNRYEIDFDDLESKFQPTQLMVPTPSRVKAMLLCNPHNPVGRVWTEAELRRMGEIVIGHGALMIADEIHGELLFKGQRHLPFATLSETFAQNSLVCMAPSKTFNLAGLEASVIIIPNDRLRQQFNRARRGFMSLGNVFGSVALEAAFNEGDEWLEQLLDYLQGNLDFLRTFFEQQIPRIQVIPPEGTYLVWLDCRGLGLDARQLMTFMNRQAKVGLDHGFIFGPSGEGFERINIACPRSLLEQALQRIKAAVDSL